MKTQVKRGRQRPTASRVEGGRTKAKAAPPKLSKPKAPPMRPKPAPAKPNAVPPVPATVLQPAANRPAVPAYSLAANKQQVLYEEAVRLFHANKFDRADALFQKVIQGPDRALAHHAQIHSQICAKRLRPPQVTFETAEDHYNYAVTMMNARRLKEAAEHLQTALQMAPNAAHVHYALAATQALQGNPQAAYERLKAAIDLEPRNRILARSDADFAAILQYPPVASLLHLERWTSPSRNRQEVE